MYSISLMCTLYYRVYKTTTRKQLKSMHLDHVVNIIIMRREH